MKTLEELLEETKQIQTLAGNLSGEISEMIHAKEEHGKDVDFASILRTAERHPITPHPLDKKDAHTVEAYLTLLLSVAERGTSPDAQDNPLVYPCRIAASLRPAPDMELLFKRSLILDEKAVNEAIAAVERERLVDFFVLDALRLIELYDRGNLQKIEYVSDLAALMNVLKERMEELLTLLKASMDETTKLMTRFKFVDFPSFLPYLSIKGYAVETPTEILVAGAQEHDVWSFFPISHKKHVYLRDIRFHGKTDPMKFSNVDSIEISGCRFEEFSSGVFEVKKCRSLKIQTSEFTNCVRKTDESIMVAAVATALGPNVPGIIGDLKDTEYLSLKSCAFNNCQVCYRYDLKDKNGNFLFREVERKEIVNCNCEESCRICP